MVAVALLLICRTRSPLMPRLNRLLMASLALLVILVVPAGVDAQQRAGGRNTVIAIPVTFPSIEARSILVREPGRDIVLLREDDASPETLMISLSVLRDARERESSPTVGEMIPITGYAVTQPAAPGYQRRLSRALSRVRDAEIVDLGSFGPGRWILYRDR